jgi:hypothetical protein
LKEKTSSTQCDPAAGATPPTTGIGQFNVGNVVRQSYRVSGRLVQAQGEIVAVTPSSVQGGYKIYVKIQGSNDFVSPPGPSETSIFPMCLLYCEAKWYKDNRKHLW